MFVEIKGKENLKEIAEQLRFDETHVGFNHDRLLIVWLEQVFELDTRGLIIIG